MLGLKEHLLTELASHFGSFYLYTLVDVTREWLENRPLSSEKHDKIETEDSSNAVENKQENAKNSSKCTAKMEPVKIASEASKASKAVESSIKSKAENSSKTVEPTATPKKTEVCRFYLQKKCKFGSNCRNLHPGWRPNTEAQPSVNSVSDTSAESICSEDTMEKSGQQDEQTGKKPRLRQAVDVISRILWDSDLQSEDFTIGYLDRFVGIIEKPFMAFSWEDLASVGHNVLAVPKHRIQYFKYRDEIVWDKRSGLDNVFGSKGGKVITDIVPPPTKSAASADSGQEASNQVQQKPEAEIKLIDDDAPTSKTGYSDKDRPTHFVCIKIQNAQVLKKVGEILQHICSCAPDLAVGCLTLEALHVTLCMLRIESETQSQAAQEVLRNLQRSFVQILPPSTVLEFTGVGNFHGRLLYAKVAPNHGLSKLVSMLMEQLLNAGVRTPGNFAEYTPHMTLLKLSRPMQREAHTATIVPALYSKFSDMQIGTQKIRTLFLCSTSGPKVDGFYETLMTLPHSFTCLPPSFMAIVSDRISQLVDHGVITPAQKETLTRSLEADGGKDLDKVVREVEKLKPKKSTSNHSSHVIILRGVPGSGKSFLSYHCSECLEDPSQVAICSADDFFTDDSKYAFSTSQLHKAHLHCFDHFLNAILDHKRVIIIDNTNSQLWEYQSFIYISNLLAIPCSVLEVPCLDNRMLEMYRARCVHNLDHAASLSMYQRWQKDSQAVVVPPKLSYPGLRKIDKENRQSFSLLSLCQPQNANIVDSTEPLVALYTGIFLTQESQWLLLNAFPPTHPEIQADHATLAFEPSLKLLLHTKIGKRVKIKVVSSVEDKNVQAAVVVLPRGLSSENQIPHITLSKQSQASSKDSNKLLDCKTYIPMKDKEIFLEGIIGVAVRKVDEVGTTNPYIILSNVDYHKLLPRMTVSNSNDSQEAISADKISICTGAQKVTQLFVFDFDLTLFNSVDPKDGREIYERATGKQWLHRGWLGHPDSLMPPLSVLPGPALADYHDHQGRAGSLTVVLTARIERTQKAVERVLKEAQVYPDEVYFKPDSTSDTETSAQFKVRIIKKLLSENKDITLVKFWDDKVENLTAVRSMADKYSNIHFNFIDATKMILKKQDSALYADLCLRGCHLSTLYSCAATVSIDFLSSQYCRMIGYQGNPKDVCYVFGSFPIGRRSDIDMCCLLQSPASPFDCIDRFAAQLEECGIIYIHKGKGARCPRLKVKLEFDCAPPIECDLIFAVIDNNLTTPGKLASSTNGGLLSSLKPSDSRSKTALTGPNFLQQVIEAIDGKMSVGEFGMVVEMTAQILRSFRQKGNAYHCIRTFHVVRLLMEYVRSPKFNQLKDSNCDEIFRNFISSVSEISPAKWQKLFGDFVPKEYVPRITDVFATVSHQVSEHPAETPLSTEIFYTDFNSRPTFPPEGYSTVSLCLHGTSKRLLWKLASLLEARLQTCIRKLLDADIDVVPDGNDSYEKFCFAIPQDDIERKSFKSCLKHLTDDLLDHQQEPLAHLKVLIS